LANPAGTTGDKNMSVSDLLKDPKALYANMQEFMSSKEQVEGGLAHMSFSNGLITAVIVAPVPIPPTEWMPPLIGAVEQSEDLADAQMVANLVLLQYNQIFSSFTNKKHPYEPFFWKDKEQKLVTKDWVDGFLYGVDLRREAWKPFMDGDGKVFMAILSILQQRDEVREKAVEIGLNPDEIFEESCKAVSKLVQQLFDRFVSKKNATSHASGPAAQKTGRNDPCPCGSGKKYKKCCLS
jgi:uncharacterized protein